MFFRETVTVTLTEGWVLLREEILLYLYSNGDWKGTVRNGGEQGVVRGAGNRLTPEGHEPERFESKLRKNKTRGNHHKKGLAIGRPSVLPVVWRVAETGWWWRIEQWH
jgi:hypothetical protein